MTTESLTFSHYDTSTVTAIAAKDVVPLYVSTHLDVIDDPFYSEERFTERFHGHMRSPHFEIVVASTEDGRAVGLAYGYALPRDARWWNGLTTPVEPHVITEDGARTFGLCELMVHPDYQGLGVAHGLHDELLYNRPEPRASLLVRDDNTAAQRAYLKWGWTRLGKLRPFPDSPHYDVLILDKSTPRRSSG